MEQRFRRLNAWSKIQELSQKFGLRPVQFIDEEFLRRFREDYQNYQRADGNSIAKMIASLLIQDRHEGLAEICDTPCPELPTNWRNALDRQGRDSSAPNWRRPLIVISEARSEEWPQASEVGFKTSTDDRISKRNLVRIETYDQHDYCEPDLDPWRLRTIGTPAKDIAGAVRERHSSRRRLPRPLELLPLDFSFDQIMLTLQQHIDWSCRQEGKAYYIPRKSWDPRTISQEDWRSEDAFPKGFSGGRKGQKDRKNRIWLWDQLHNDHWDVQCPGGGHRNVTPDGSVL
jgi:hypothetical protein